MNRENEEQRPVAQTICGALQKEPNCKCLVLSVLIYGCLAAVTWCRCANVTKVVINFSRYPIKSTKHVSPCDDGYIYIPVAFMGMLYLVYLVECYHSPIRLDLLHAESQDSVLSRLSQLRSAQPTIWWKAVSYHYVRRKRQITRYRNGDNYTTTQVYYERINTHVATSFYYYDYCGVKDISKELILDPKIPITKIMLTKGFAFSNVRSATEFEEARSRFFAEQELRDDYMEMREGLDLGYNPNPTTLIAVLGNPWFANRYLYWCLSALLLSWPLRVIIEYKTQYADYQVTKLFGVHYDTPTGSEPIHTSMSQLSQPGSYMLAPSYSEALLMDAAPVEERVLAEGEEILLDMVPSYSEALLYERAGQRQPSAMSVQSVNAANTINGINGIKVVNANGKGDASASANASADPLPYALLTSSGGGECKRREADGIASADKCSYPPEGAASDSAYTLYEGQLETCHSQGRREPAIENSESGPHIPHANAQVEVENERVRETNNKPVSRLRRVVGSGKTGAIPRDMSEPNLGTLRSQAQVDLQFLKLNGKSLQNILEAEQDMDIIRKERRYKVNRERILEVGNVLAKFEGLVAPLSLAESIQLIDSSKGAIPKRRLSSNRIITNPMPSDNYYRVPTSKSHFSLKSILKQSKRPPSSFSKVRDGESCGTGAPEIESFSRAEDLQSEENADPAFLYQESSNLYEGELPAARAADANTRFVISSRGSRESLDDTVVTADQRKNRWISYLSGTKSEPGALIDRRDNPRTLIFASPIQEVCPNDPFGGKNLVRTRQQRVASPPERLLGQTFLQLSSPLNSTQSQGHQRKQRYSFSCSVEHTTPSAIYPEKLSASSDAVDNCESGKYEKKRPYKTGFSFPPYIGRSVKPSQKHSNETVVEWHAPPSDPEPDHNQHNQPHTHTSALSLSPSPSPSPSWSLSSSARNAKAELTRSLTERRTKLARENSNLRRSFTGRIEDYRIENGQLDRSNHSRTNLLLDRQITTSFYIEGKIRTYNWSMV